MASLVAHPCAACAQSHPIFNFIFQYYFIEKRILLRWTPGPGVLVRGAAPVEPLLWQGRGWQAHADGGHYDPRQLHSGKPGRLIGLRRARDILRRTAERAAHLNCFGMHEWAMLYQPDGERAPPRHQQLPLRLEQAALTLTLTLALALALTLTLTLTLTLALTLALTRCAVELRQYPKTHPFAGTQYADNIVAFNTERYTPQPLVVQGPGAGAAVTAAGIYADFLKIAKSC